MHFGLHIDQQNLFHRRNIIYTQPMSKRLTYNKQAFQLVSQRSFRLHNNSNNQQTIFSQQIPHRNRFHNTLIKTTHNHSSIFINSTQKLFQKHNSIYGKKFSSLKKHQLKHRSLMQKEFCFRKERSQVKTSTCNNHILRAFTSLLRVQEKHSTILSNAGRLKILTNHNRRDYCYHMDYYHQQNPINPVVKLRKGDNSKIKTKQELKSSKMQEKHSKPIEKEVLCKGKKDQTNEESGNILGNPMLIRPCWMRIKMNFREDEPTEMLIQFNGNSHKLNHLESCSLQADSVTDDEEFTFPLAPQLRVEVGLNESGRESWGNESLKLISQKLRLYQSGMRMPEESEKQQFQEQDSLIEQRFEINSQQELEQEDSHSHDNEMQTQESNFYELEVFTETEMRISTKQVLSEQTNTIHNEPTSSAILSSLAKLYQEVNQDYIRVGSAITN